jgi:ornithine carbamoyltransferase
MVRHRRHLISLNDLSDSELRLLVDRGIGLRASRMNQVRSLQDHVVGIYFRKTSTRTRTAFSSGALRLGAQIISIGPHDLQENTGESIEDTTSVLSEMLDGFVARTAGPREEMLTLASQSRMAVINAMSADEHPTQAVADLTTLNPDPA